MGACRRPFLTMLDICSLKTFSPLTMAAIGRGEIQIGLWDKSAKLFHTLYCKINGFLHIVGMFYTLTCFVLCVLDVSRFNPKIPTILAIALSYKLLCSKIIITINSAYNSFSTKVIIPITKEFPLNCLSREILYVLNLFWRFFQLYHK